MESTERDLADLRKECSSVHAARLETAAWGCRPVSDYRRDYSALVVHVDEDDLCACPLCDEARRARVREAGRRIMLRYARPADELVESGIRSISRDDQSDSATVFARTPLRAAHG